MSVKVIVAHPGKQHSYRMATAIKKSGCLFRYITTVYNKKKKSFLMSLANKVLRNDNKKKALNRQCKYLEDGDVLQFCEFRGFIETFLARYNKKLYAKYRQKTADKFGKKVAKYAIKNNVDAVICYDTNSTVCFETLKRYAPNVIRILDCSATAIPYVKFIYEREIEKTRDDSLKKENICFWDDKLFADMQKEICLANFCFVASSFVKKSLVYCGVDESKIKVIPYGVDVCSNTKREYTSEPLRFLFVGNVNYNKGVPYLLKAISELQNCTLTIVGTYDKNAEYIKPYIDNPNINFVGSVIFDKVRYYYENADVFVIDSFADGFAQVVIEAMSYGLPIICSDNVGAKDLIRNYVNGFVIPCGDLGSLKEKMQWFIDNKGKILQMGECAKVTAEKYTWEEYEKRVSSALDGILSR